MRNTNVNGSLVGALLVALTLCAACEAKKGDCPSVADCACPCTDEVAPVCDNTGTPYPNRCMLECDGGSVTDCPTDNGPSAPSQVDICACGGEPADEVCGALGNGGARVYQLYPSACERECAGARPAPLQQCT